MNRPQWALAVLALCSLAALMMLLTSCSPCATAFAIGCAPFETAAPPVNERPTPPPTDPHRFLTRPLLRSPCLHHGTTQRKERPMTNTLKTPENHGNASTVHSPKAPGDVEKVNPQTGGTTTESTHVGKNPNKR